MSAYLSRLKHFDEERILISPSNELTKLTKATVLTLLTTFGGFGSTNQGNNKIIDTPQALLDVMRLGGYSLSVNGNDLHIDQAHWIDYELAALISTHKTDLIKILESEVTQ